MDMGGCYSCQNIEFIDLSIRDVAATYKGDQATNNARPNQEISHRFDQAFEI
jgi:hypothetical protein